MFGIRKYIKFLKLRSKLKTEFKEHYQGPNKQFGVIRLKSGHIVALIIDTGWIYETYSIKIYNPKGEVVKYPIKD